MDNRSLLFCNVTTLSAHPSLIENCAGRDTISRSNLYNGTYTMESTRWNTHDGIHTMESIQWIESTRWIEFTMESTRWNLQWNLHDGNYTIESTQWNLHNGIHTMQSSASLMFSVAFEHHVFSHLPCIQALFLSPSLSNISFARYARLFVPPIYSGALQRTPFAAHHRLHLKGTHLKRTHLNLQPVQPFSPSLLLP